MDNQIFIRGGDYFTGKYAVVGCGGVGSWVALLLTIAGAKEIMLVDPDVVEESNLNRTIFRKSDIGLPKAVALSNILSEMRNIVVIPVVAEYPVKIPANFAPIYCTDTFTKEEPVPLSVGYDGEMITITNDKLVAKKTFSSDSRVISGYTESNVLSSIMCAWIILAGYKYWKYTDRHITIHLVDIINKILGGNQ